MSDNKVDYSFDPRIKPGTIVKITSRTKNTKYNVGKLARVIGYFPGFVGSQWPVWGKIKFQEDNGPKTRCYNLHSLDYVSEADGTVKAKSDSE